MSDPLIAAATSGDEHAFEALLEKHYAVHLKNSLDAAAINVRKVR